MSDRLRPRDLVFWATETPRVPLHNVTVEIFEPGEDGFEYPQLLALIADRISFVPRYRQRVQNVPGFLANPVWADDPDFDLTYHVRRSALPRPGTMEQLRELTARIVSRPLDRTRPLWEVYYVEGLEKGRVAVLTKSHQLLVDGVETVDIGQVLLDVDPGPRPLEHDDWVPEGPPSSASLMVDALYDSVTEPSTVVNTVRSNTQAFLRASANLASWVGRRAGGPVPDSPITGRISQQRRLVTVRADLADFRRVRDEHGGTINDVILATIAGGLRAWLVARDESLGALRTLRALVPMSVIDDELEPTSLGSQVAAHHVELPVGEVSPVVRLHQVSYSFRARVRKSVT